MAVVVVSGQDQADQVFVPGLLIEEMQFADIDIRQEGNAIRGAVTR